MSILRMASWIRRYLRCTKAVSALEYAVIVGLLVVGLSAAVIALRDQIRTYIGRQATAVSTLS